VSEREVIACRRALADEPGDVSEFVMLPRVEVAGVLIWAGDWLEACATEFAMPGEFGEGCSLTTGTDSVADSN
jgi:hypothetical protein